MIPKRVLLILACLGLVGCSGGGSVTISPLVNDRVTSQPNASDAILSVADSETLHPLDVAHIGPESLTRAQGNTPSWEPDVTNFRETRALGIARRVDSTAGLNDHEDAGMLTPGGGAYTAVQALHAVYLRNVDVMSAPKTAGTQYLYAPTTKVPNHGCLEAGTAYTNTAGLETTPQFFVFDFCANPPSFTYRASVDTAWNRTYVRKSPNRLPSYDVMIATHDAVPSSSSTWLAALYNYQTQSFNIVYQSSGLTNDAAGWSVFEFYYQPGQCPSLPSFEMRNLAYYNASTRTWDSVKPTMNGLTTAMSFGIPGNCFVTDATGNGSYIFSVLQPNSSWRVGSTGS